MYGLLFISLSPFGNLPLPWLMPLGSVIASHAGKLILDFNIEIKIHKIKKNHR